MQLPDGYSIILTTAFPSGGNINLFISEREVQPPKMSLGGPIDTVTMRNMFVTTKASKSLVDFGAITIQARYDPGIYIFLSTIVVDRAAAGAPPPGRAAGTRWRMGENAPHTLTFPDGFTGTFWGWYEEITPPSHKAGDMPLMEVKIEISNRNSAGTETPPTFSTAAQRGAGSILR